MVDSVKNEMDLETEEYIKEYVHGSDPSEEQKLQIQKLFDDIRKSEEFLASKEEAEEYLTIYNGHRFLAARNYNHKPAFNLLKAHIKWRYKIYKPSEIRAKDVEVYSRKGAVQSTPRGRDKFNRPILYLDNTKDNVHHKKSKVKQRESMKHLVFHLERTFAMFTKDVRRYVLFINLQDFRLLSAPNLSTTKETVNIFSSQYPEKLGLAVMYKAPWAFSQFWGAIKYAIDKSTRKKIIFITGDTSDGSKNDLKLKKLMGDDWKITTGVGLPRVKEDCTPGYDHTVIWKQVEDFEKARLSQDKAETNNEE